MSLQSEANADAAAKRKEIEEAAKSDMKERVINCPATKALKDHTQEFEKKVYKVTEGVYVAVGYAIANSILLEAPDGVIVVDTTETITAMKEIWTEFRKITQKPLKGIIYTHSHKDHIGGAEAILEEDKSDIEIWAHVKFLEIRKTYDTLLKGCMTPRNIRQFGIGIEQMGGLVNSGIGAKLHADYNNTFVWPNKLMEGEGSQDISIAGLPLRLVYIPGETQCQMGVWIPSKKVFLPGDNFYRSFPNLYAIRGTVPRSVTCWVSSLDIIRNLYPDHLVPSHTRPLSGQSEIQLQLTNYRDAIQYVHDQTLRLMNRGLHPVEIARSIVLPPSLRDVPYLQCFYGTPEWSSRAVFDAYIGWFSGSPEELFPLTPTERGRKMVEFFGADQIIREAELAMTESDLQWALELSSHVFLTDPDHKAAKSLRARAILGLAAQQVSANGRNYLLTYLLEDYGVLPRKYPSAKVVLSMPLDIVFKRMAFTIKAEQVENVTMTVVMKLSDLEKIYSFYVRNCILEVEEFEASRRDMFLCMDSNNLRQILAGSKTAQDLYKDKQIDIDMQEEVLYKFFNCFELGDDIADKRS